MKSWEEIIDILKKKLVSLGDVTITPAVLLTVVLIILGAFWVSCLLRGMLRRSLFRRTHLKHRHTGDYLPYIALYHNVNGRIYCHTTGWS